MRRKQIALNSIWNVAGQLSPILVAIAALPFLIRNIGIERYGLLTLIWVLIGYAGLFDLGIGRALTRLVAQRLASERKPEAQHLANVGLTLLLLCGLVAGLGFASCSSLLATKVLHVSDGLTGEATLSLLLVALSLPLVMLTSGYTGVMSAYLQFKPLNLIKVCMGFLTYGGPALMSFYTPNLSAAVGVLLAMRVLSTIAHALACKRYCGQPLGLAVPRRQYTSELLSLGGWITVSNVVSPLLGYMDRFVVAALVPVSFVAYYATSFDLLARSMVLPYAFVAAIFPLASTMMPGQAATSRMFHESARALLGLMFPVTFGFFVLAAPGLQLWLGDEFARHGAPVLQVLAVGVLVNTLAQAPATLIQAAGKPRWMALAHIAELPVFVFGLWLLTERYGIIGTAIAASLRNVVDAAIVTVLAVKGLSIGKVSPRFWLHAAVVSALFGGALWVEGTLATLAYLAVGLLAFCGYFWVALMSPDDRRAVLAWRLPRKTLPSV